MRIELIKLIWILSFLLAVSVQDLRKKKISLGGILLFGAGGILTCIFHFQGIVPLLCSLCPGICVLLLVILTKEQIGLGDALLIGELGFYLAFPKLCLVLLCAFFCVFLCAVLLYLLKKAGKKTRIPFCPFLFFGVFLGGFLPYLTDLR